MIKAGKFERVSIKQFEADLAGIVKPEGVETPDAAASYDAIAMPVRATAGSAGYDIKAPFAFTLKPGESIKVPTGLRCRIEEGWVLCVMPKSGLGTKFRLQLDNTIGVIDQDYYNADNEGHIMIQVTNDSNMGKTVEIPQGKAFVQAIFLPFGITEDDAADGERKGGFGSTGA